MLNLHNRTIRLNYYTPNRHTVLKCVMTYIHQWNTCAKPQVHAPMQNQWKKSNFITWKFKIIRLHWNRSECVPPLNLTLLHKCVWMLCGMYLNPINDSEWLFPWFLALSDDVTLSSSHHSGNASRKLANPSKEEKTKKKKNIIIFGLYPNSSKWNYSFEQIARNKCTLISSNGTYFICRIEHRTSHCSSPFSIYSIQKWF